MKKLSLWRFSAMVIAVVFGLLNIDTAAACTGISFVAQDGSPVTGRTMECGTFVMDSRYVIVPRGHTQVLQTPSGNNGIKIVTKYGYVGIGVLDDNLMAEGVNEKGLLGELFYFPGYGSYEPYDERLNATTLTDAEFLTWVLANFATVSDMEKAIHDIHVVPYGKGFGTAHFNLADATGRRVVVEYIDGKLNLHENKIGVITNAPSFDWHMTNLNSYANVFAGNVPPREVVPGVTIKPFGMGAASLGLPGDLTPPSRFVRAAFYVHTARPQATGHKAVLQTFQILNNFDIPVGAEYRSEEVMPNMISATQWTTATDLKALKFYYRTQYNSAIRCIDLKTIDFGKVQYQVAPLEKVTEQPVEYIRIS